MWPTQLGPDRVERALLKFALSRADALAVPDQTVTNHARSIPSHPTRCSRHHQTGIHLETHLAPAGRRSLQETVRSLSTQPAA